MDAAMCDQLTRGRYMFGFGVGGPGADQMAQRGLGDNSTEVRRARMHEAIDLILRAWTATEPFDYAGQFWQGTGINVLPRPYNKPYMPVGVASSTSMGTVDMAGRKQFLPLFSQYDEPGHMREMASGYLNGATAAGHAAERKAIRACRYVYVSKTTRQAKEELRPSITPSIERHKKGFPHHFAHSLPPSGKVEDVTWDHLVDSGHYFVGDPDRVCELIKNFHDASGGFGVLLLLVGKDYGTREQRTRSLRLFMEQVAPWLRDLDPDRTAPLEAVY
jgi:alkanesulfonate monooxygenase SsuD/methylene tetrahydromethanopterin reductase-like flavin-dependent oxidoreductase (luciferase family)